MKKRKQTKDHFWSIVKPVLGADSRIKSCFNYAGTPVFRKLRSDLYYDHLTLQSILEDVLNEKTETDN